MLSQLEIIYLYPDYLADDTTMQYTWGGEMGCLPCAIQPLSVTASEYLQHLPNLHQIQFPGTLSNEVQWLPSEYDWIDLKSPGSLNKVFLIRTYVRQGETFTHCRLYSAYYCHIEDGVVYRAQEVWEEYTDYMGHIVPANILSEIYNAAGKSVAWFRPGRGLDICAGAWDVLKQWRVSEIASRRF